MLLHKTVLKTPWNNACKCSPQHGVGPWYSLQIKACERRKWESALRKSQTEGITSLILIRYPAWILLMLKSPLCMVLYCSVRADWWLEGQKQHHQSWREASVSRTVHGETVWLLFAGCGGGWVGGVARAGVGQPPEMPLRPCVWSLVSDQLQCKWMGHDAYSSFCTNVLGNAFTARDFPLISLRISEIIASPYR